MKKEKKKSSETISLRQRAEKQIRKNHSAKTSSLTEIDILKLNNELEMHQIELEMQNEELRLAIDKANIATEKFTTLYDFAPMGYFTLDRDSIICELNLSGARMLGKERFKLVNANFKHFVSNDTRTLFNDFLKKALETKSKQTCEIRLIAEGNKLIYVYIEGMISGEEQKCLVTVVDITEHTLLEKELLKEKNQLKTIINSSPASIWFKDTKNNFISINNAAAKIANSLIENVEGHSADEIFPTESAKYYKDDLDVINSGKPKLGIIEPASAYGITTWLRTDKIPWYDADGNIAGVIVFALDITDSIRADKKLQTSETRYRRLFESAKDGILILDAESGQIVDVNPFLIELLNYSPNEFKDMEIWEIGIFKDIFANKAKFDELKKTGYIRYENLPLETKDGQHINVEFISNVYLVDNKKVIQCNIRNITERMQVEEALRESEERFHSMFEKHSAVMILINPNTNKIIDANLAGAKFYGYSIEQLRQMKISDMNIMPEKGLDSEVKESETYLTFPHRLNSGEIINVEVYTSPISMNGETVLFSIIHDITERKNAEEEVILSREKLRALTARLEKAKEEERINLSRELHDNLGQSLTGLKMDTVWLTKKIKNSGINNPEIILGKTQSMTELIDETINNVRRISADLRPNILDYLGLLPSLEWQLQDFKKRSEIECKFISQIKDIKLTQATASSVFRILQEVLTNIVRHTKATYVELRIDETDEFYSIQIIDNGRGISSDQLDDVHSLGITGMKERTLQFDGELIFSGIKDRGTKVMLKIPKGSLL
ncbi:MAG: PAS domain S-box protein [Ignavibacteriota bacterium]